MFENIIKTFGALGSKALATARIEITGMTCKNCVRTVKKALLTGAGVKKVYVDLNGGFASVTYDPAQTDVPTLEKIILRKGYFPAQAAAQAPA